jgi:hypothetical protein
MDNVGDSVGVVTQERTPGCDKQKIPVRALRVEISRHQDRESSAQALCQVRLDRGSCGRELGRYDLHCSGRQHQINGSSRQELQTRDWYSIMIYASMAKDRCAYVLSRAVRQVANIVM